MKQLIYICLLCLAVVSCKDDDQGLKVSPDDFGEWTDPETDITYGYVRIGNLEWMTSNLKSGMPYYEEEYELGDDEWYEVEAREMDFDFEADLEKYGNLYTWEGAQEACPEGWEIPTDEDWKSLERALGMSAGEANDEGWRGNKEGNLIRKGKEGCGIALQLSGNASLATWGDLYLNIDEFGYFWTSTEQEDNGLANPTYYFRKIFATSSQIYRGATPADKLMRVRCIRRVN